MKLKDNWYVLKHPELTDSPALLIFPGHIRYNINEMVDIAGSPERLIPHVKTYKMSALVKMQLEAGISRFKCATIAEAEMLGMTGVQEVLMAYQLNGPKIHRFVRLVKKYRKTHFSSLIDNDKSADILNDVFAKEGMTASVYIDIDTGMHRTGYPVLKDVASFYKKINGLSSVHCMGLHVYDGHVNETDIEKRKKHCEVGFEQVKNTAALIEASGLSKPKIIAGGSPTFPIHASHPDVFCSPGTTLLWDSGYSRTFPDLHFKPAAIVMTRIISKPVPGKITIDLGYKSVAAERPIDTRISFLNLENYTAGTQSEEHWEILVDEKKWYSLEIGDVLYGMPYHICPTVALYDQVQVVENGIVVDNWRVEARGKQIDV